MKLRAMPSKIFAALAIVSAVMTSACRKEQEDALLATAKVLIDAAEYDMNSLVVVTLNVQDKPESEATTAARIRRIANSMQQKIGPWGIIGFQELRYSHDAGVPLIGEILLSSDYFRCADGSEGYAVDCFARQFGTGIAIGDRALGVIANEQYWEMIAGSKIHAHIGTPRNDVIYRTVLGARFRNKRSGKTVAVYTVHISNTDNNTRQLEEVTYLVAFIRAWYVAGDLPSVVVGDFNCESWSAGVRNTLLTTFSKASDVPSIDLVFTGRPGAFPGATEMWQPVAGSAQRYDVREENPPDHLSTAVRLIVQPIADVAAGSMGYLDPSEHCP